MPRNVVLKAIAHLKCIFIMGDRRQALAMQRYAGAVGAVVGVILLFLLLRLSEIGIFLYAAGLVGAYYLYRDGQHLMKRADDVFRGEAAERQVALELEPLKRRNWEVKHNVKLKKWGDADIVLRSPKDNWYVVDVW
jgi:hypothetical protein